MKTTVIKKIVFVVTILVVALLVAGCPTANSPSGAVPPGARAYSPDGQYYAREIERDTGYIGVFATFSGEEVWTWDTLYSTGWYRNTLKGLAWSPDSQRVAVMYHGSSGSFIYVFRLFQEEIVSRGQADGYYHAMRFAADGQGVWLSDGPSLLPRYVPLEEVNGQ